MIIEEILIIIYYYYFIYFINCHLSPLLNILIKIYEFNPLLFVISLLSLSVLYSQLRTKAPTHALLSALATFESSLDRIANTIKS